MPISNISLENLSMALFRTQGLNGDCIFHQTVKVGDCHGFKDCINGGLEEGIVFHYRDADIDVFSAFLVRELEVSVRTAEVKNFHIRIGEVKNMCQR